MSIELTRGTTGTPNHDGDHLIASGGLITIDLQETAVVIRLQRQDAESISHDGPMDPGPPGADEEEPTWEDAEWQ
jgi:hypothetical protein